jgi:hypothetical protein
MLLFPKEANEKSFNQLLISFQFRQLSIFLFPSKLKINQFGFFVCWFEFVFESVPVNLNHPKDNVCKVKKFYIYQQKKPSIEINYFLSIFSVH